jgi:hypothetical protein
MNKALLIAGIVLIVVFIIYLVITNIVNDNTFGLQLVSDAPVDLMEEKMIVNSDVATQVLSNGAGSTIFGYVYLESGDKTRITDQSNTKTLMRQDGMWSIDVKNDGRLVLSIAGLNNTSSTFELPVMPYQKWVALTIVRDGRRYDIYYNGELAASYRINKYPYSRLSPLRAGSAGIRGKIAKVHIANRAYNGHEISNIYKSTSDTRGVPYIKSSFTIPSFGCPSGLFCSITSSPPASPYQRWSTQYS